MKVSICKTDLGFSCRSIFSVLMCIILISCGSGPIEEKSELAHAGDPFEVSNSWQICNQESFDLYMTLAHVDYSGIFTNISEDPYSGVTQHVANSEVHGWVLVGKKTCVEVGAIWKPGLVLLRSEEGPYEISNGELSSGSAVCVNSVLKENETISWKALSYAYSMKPHGNCPSGSVLKDRFIYEDLPNRDLSGSNGHYINGKFTLKGGVIRSDGDRLTEHNPHFELTLT